MAEPEVQAHTPDGPRSVEAHKRFPVPIPTRNSLALRTPSPQSPPPRRQQLQRNAPQLLQQNARRVANRNVGVTLAVRARRANLRWAWVGWRLIYVLQIRETVDYFRAFLEEFEYRAHRKALAPP